MKLKKALGDFKGKFTIFTYQGEEIFNYEFP